jgi:hypothetical protein
MSRTFSHRRRNLSLLATCTGVAIIFATGQLPAGLGAASAQGSASTLPLLQSSDLVYTGAFRVPAWAGDANSFDYGGTALAYWPAHNSLLMVGHAQYQRAAELAIPAVRNNVSTVGGLDRATYLQPLTDVLAGHLTDVGSTSSQIGGLLPTSTALVVSDYIYYDGLGSQSKSHFKSGLNFAALGTVSGPYQVGNTEAGFVSGYMAPIPAAWQASLGGTALTGNCCIPIISRTSYGPSVSVFNPGDVGVADPVPATRVLGYPAGHASLGQWDSTGQLFNGSTQVTGVVFPEGTRSVLFFGRRGVGPFCYGPGTSDPSLAGTPAPPSGVDPYCYDPTAGSKGTHSYPYVQFVWAYDANDLAAVKAGTKNQWDVLPYATWTFDTPFENPQQAINGAAYDPATGRVFVSVGFEDGTAPLIQVLTIQTGSTTPQLQALSATVVGSGTVTSTPAGLTCASWTCAANFPSGSIVQMSAAPATGWSFNGWSGACTGTLSCYVSMTSARTVTATFTQGGQTVPTITWATPASVVSGTVLGATQLNATASVAGAFSYAPVAGTALTSGTTTLTATFTPTNTTSYTAATASVSLTVTSTTKTVPTITWPGSDGIAYGMPLSSIQLKATASVPGTMSYTPASGTVLSAGMQMLSVVFAPTDPTLYASATASSSLMVQKATPVVAWATPASVVAGSSLGATQLNATANVAGTFSYAPAAGTILTAGTTTLTATFTPTDTTDYNAKTASVNVTVTSGQTVPTIAWATPAAIVYGTALGATQLNATASAPGTMAYTPATGTVLSAGVRTLSVAFTPTNTTLYTSATASVSLTVQKVTPVITWPTPTAVVDGTVLGPVQLNATANVAGNFSYWPAAGTVMLAGTTTLSTTFTPTNAINYSVIAATVSLMVASPNPSSNKANIGFYRPASGTWYELTAASNWTTSSIHQWGLPGDQPLRADFDGDGKPDIVAFRPSNATWYILFSGSNFSYANWTSYQWGLPGDVPMPADVDGDGKTDLVVWRPSDGTWYVRFSSSNYSYWVSYKWGLPGDIPVAQDFDGDGKTDFAVWRPNNGTWYVLYSANHFSYSKWDSYQWGLPGDIPVAQDFDGDGEADLAVWRPSNGTWYLLLSSKHYSYSKMGVYQWGLPGDVPVLGDFDADGKADLMVWRPSNGTWYGLYSITGYSYSFLKSYVWGLSTDVPLAGR